MYILNSIKKSKCSVAAPDVLKKNKLWFICYNVQTYK